MNVLAAKEFVLTAGFLSNIIRRKLNSECPVCNLPLMPGQKIVSRLASKRRMYYHEKCYETLFIEVAA